MRSMAFWPLPTGPRRAGAGRTAPRPIAPSRSVPLLPDVEHAARRRLAAPHPMHGPQPSRPAGLPIQPGNGRRRIPAHALLDDLDVLLRRH
jgi:hypothetical protein